MKKQSNSESKNALMFNNRRYKYLTLCLHSKQLKNKTKQCRLHYYKNVAQCHNPVSLQVRTSWHEQITLEGAVAKCHSNSKKVETAIAWARVMTKISVSYAILRLYMRMLLCVDLVKKKYFLLCLFLESDLSTFVKT